MERHKTSRFLSKLNNYFNGFDLDIHLNNNRVVMLKVLEKTRKKMKLSIHEMFVEAPEEVLDSMGKYFQGEKFSKESTCHAGVLRRYVHENLSKYDYTNKISEDKIHSQGQCYDLQKIFDELNETYFDNQVKTRITWKNMSVRGNSRHKKHILFGVCDDAAKIIRINSQLDLAFVPSFFVEFVVYHEMLHCVVPPQVDANGRCSMHGKEFKEREREFFYYKEAQKWEKDNLELFFKYRER